MKKQANGGVNLGILAMRKANEQRRLARAGVALSVGGQVSVDGVRMSMADASKKGEQAKQTDKANAKAKKDKRAAEHKAASIEVEHTWRVTLGFKQGASDTLEAHSTDIKGSGIRRVVKAARVALAKHGVGGELLSVIRTDVLS